jgi:dipeptidyl aminopeptidase/acylaminoacyl peptidase
MCVCGAGTPWKSLDLYNKWNPAAHTDKWSTPTLVIHGGMDFRLPVTEGLSAFTALQRRNIPSKLLVFPMENHWVLKPQNRYTVCYYCSHLFPLTSINPPQLTNICRVCVCV